MRGSVEITRRELLRRGAGAAALAGLGGLGLAGCGSERGDGGVDSGGPVEIEYWNINDQALGLREVNGYIRQYEERNPNVTVRNQSFEDYTVLVERIQTSLASNRPPDVAQIGFFYLDYVPNNFPFKAAEQLAERYAPSGFLADNFSDRVLDLGRFGGEVVAMPYSLSNPVIYYNADMLSEAGVDPENPPRTWEEWREAARRVTDVTGDPALFLDVDTYISQAMVESNGGRMLGCAGGEATASFDSPEAVEAIGLWDEMIEEGLILYAEPEAGSQSFLSQNAAAYVTSIADRAGLQAQASFDFRGTYFPTFGDREVRLPTGGNMLFVLSQDEAKERAAWRFVEHLLSPESLTAWTKGTGYLPPREGVADDPRYLGAFLEENSIQRVAVEQLDDSVTWVAFPGPNGLQASNALSDALQSAFSGQTGAQEALRDAAAEVDGLIEGEACS